MIEIWFQAPKQQRVTFEDSGLLRVCNLHPLLRCIDEEIKTLDPRQRESSDDFNRKQQQEKDNVNYCDIKETLSQWDLI